MGIQKVKIKKFKKLQDIDIDFEDKNFLILGDNGVGKSSLLQFMEIAMGNTTHIPPDAFGKGEVIYSRNGQKYVFHVEMDGGKVKKLTVTGEDNLTEHRKTIIGSLVGSMEFDINEFVDLSKSTAGRKKQVEIFKKFLPKEALDFIEKTEAHIQVKYNERTELGRSIVKIKAECDSNPLAAHLNLDQFKKIDNSKQFQEMNEAIAHNTHFNEIKGRHELRKQQIDEKKNAIDALKLQILGLEKEVVGLDEQNTKAAEWMLHNPEKNVEAMQSSIKLSQDTNKRYEQAQELKKKRMQYEEMVNEQGEMTALIDSQRQAVSDAIKDIASPVPGLSFDADNLLYNGIVVSAESLSSSEIIELGIKLKMAENPDLGVLFIQRGESLGKKRLEEILSIANKAGWQVLMEQVERGTEELRIEIIPQL